MFLSESHSETLCGELRSIRTVPGLKPAMFSRMEEQPSHGDHPINRTTKDATMEQNMKDTYNIPREIVPKSCKQSKQILHTQISV